MKSVSAYVTTGIVVIAFAATAAAGQSMNPPAPMAVQQTGAGPMAADGAGAQAYAPSAQVVSPGEPGTTRAEISALRNGDNRTVTNGPVPDTPANRARFGRPMSHAGKKTPPAGN